MTLLTRPKFMKLPKQILPDDRYILRNGTIPHNHLLPLLNPSGSSIRKRLLRRNMRLSSWDKKWKTKRIACINPTPPRLMLSNRTSLLQPLRAWMKTKSSEFFSNKPLLTTIMLRSKGIIEYTNLKLHLISLFNLLHQSKIFIVEKLNKTNESICLKMSLLERCTLNIRLKKNLKLKHQELNISHRIKKVPEKPVQKQTSKSDQLGDWITHVAVNILTFHLNRKLSQVAIHPLDDLINKERNNLMPLKKQSLVKASRLSASTKISLEIGSLKLEQQRSLLNSTGFSIKKVKNNMKVGALADQL